MAESPDLRALPSLPRDEEGPVFRAPWEAQAFAMALTLHAQGQFTWKEWASRLAAEIRAAAARGEPDDGTTYYEHWLAALEKLVAEKGLLSTAALARRAREWEVAARETAPGRPIELRRGPE
ncbi:MAG: nitrile hydratase accessory protein [Candidatus Rokubacteria bacterium]|nr:nitrile hydratase accessory protein [Candidatus Rokubacteria bacterium]